ncbi:MAG: hypothetical protein ABMA14_25680, partial [Hyphomonadaceae bacterium]
LFSSASAQSPSPKTPSSKTPPPTVQAVVTDPSIPHLLKNKLDNSLCQYPNAARRAALEGCCRMKVKVGADSRVIDIGGECTDEVFFRPSQICLQPQQYTPARKGKKSVTGVGEIVVFYSLARPPSLWSAIGGLFTKPMQETPEPELCRKRSTDMISQLSTARG